MKRKTVHLSFACFSLCLLGLSFLQWREIEQAADRKALVNEIPPKLTLDSETGDWQRFPESRLAYANALSAGGDFEGAEAAFSELIRQFPDSEIGYTAQFNLANAYLRQGMREDQTANRRRTMLELGKQRYRAILRSNPDDWQVRFNLERALRLAPEHDDYLDGNKDVIKRVNVVVPDFKMKDLP